LAYWHRDGRRGACNTRTVRTLGYYATRMQAVGRRKPHRFELTDRHGRPHRVFGFRCFYAGAIYYGEFAAAAGGGRLVRHGQGEFTAASGGVTVGRWEHDQLVARASPDGDDDDDAVRQPPPLTTLNKVVRTAAGGPPAMPPPTELAYPEPALAEDVTSMPPPEAKGGEVETDASALAQLWDMLGVGRHAGSADSTAEAEAVAVLCRAFGQEPSEETVESMQADLAAAFA
jgi:hypothetical protein